MFDLIHRAGILYSLAVLLIAPLELGIAFLVLKSDTKNKCNRMFFIFAVSMVVFLITNYLADGLTNAQYALWDLRLYFVSTTALTSFIFFFSFVFPKDRKVKPFIVWALWGYAIFTAISSVFPLIMQGVTIETWGVNIVPGPLFFPHNIIDLLLLVTFLVDSIIQFVKSSGIARRQLFFLNLGFYIFFVVNIVVNVILPITSGTAQWARFGSYASVAFVLLAAYAIAIHHLFDIRIIIRRTVIFSALIGFIFLIYSLIIYIFTITVSTQSGGLLVYGKTNLAVNMISILIISFSFEPLKKWLEERTDKWLFKKEYEQQVVMKELSTKLNNVVDMEDALEGVMQTITRVLHLRHAVTYVFQPGENNMPAVKRIKQIGYSATTHLMLEERDFTIQFFSTHLQTCILEDFYLEIEREKELIANNKLDATAIRQHAIKVAVAKKLKSLNVAVAIPLHLNTQPLGLILLSDKLSGETFSQQDLALLELVGGQAISSIQKAKLYEGDQMKSEFVSIASHELLTPISAMEGYLSMILDEGIGKVDPQARDYLTKVYTSARRLSELIKDLLSVSRIESGKMTINLQQLDIGKMITDTLDQLRFVAAKKEIKVTFIKPEGAIPPVWADPDRTMQIMVNLVSNSIKYTPKGTVSITTTVDKKSEFVTINVADTGLGMSKAQMSHLFTRFYRVDTPQTMGILGTGLGLYITKSLIEKMGGTIVCKSVVGEGSTFTFTLPVFKVETSTAG